MAPAAVVVDEFNWSVSFSLGWVVGATNLGVSFITYIHIGAQEKKG